MTQQIINIGALPNDGSGDPLRTAFNKINTNFTELYSTGEFAVEVHTIGADPNQVIFEYPLATFTQGKFQINSSNPSTPNSQNISLSAAKNNNGTAVRYATYGSIVDGAAVTTYNMDVSGGNLRILSSPLTTDVLIHFIVYQISFIGTSPPGIELSLDGYLPDSLMTTEGDLILTTET